ncbi:MAG TPA: DUF5996 family protein [Myxococcales bacterium]|nr:DUF5996 family protein [Myxococcales bacterium]
MEWPTLQMPSWQQTRATLHMWTQIVGKTRLVLAPFQNHWWHVPLYVSARGLTTSPMPWGERTLEIEFDFSRHVLELRPSDGRVVGIGLTSRPVAEFFREYKAALDSLGVRARFLERPVEVRESIPFAKDFKHATYDPAWAGALWRVLQSVRNVFEQFRGEFIGKASPVHVFWGGLDLAATRFSGRTAPRHSGGAPNCPDYVMVEAYSHEVSSAGFWPGDESFPEAVFFSYAYPEPPGFAAADPGPAEARYDGTLHEFVLPYEKARLLPDPAAALLKFLRSTYAAAASLGKWDRAALERVPAGPLH